MRIIFRVIHSPEVEATSTSATTSAPARGRQSLCMADTWHRLSGGAGNKPLYQHLWWDHGMHVMWAASEVQMDVAAHGVKM